MSSSHSSSSRSPESGEEQEDCVAEIQAHFDLLNCTIDSEELNTFGAVPIFTNNVREHTLGRDSVSQINQYGLLGANISDDESSTAGDPRVFYNIAGPTSIFVCGSQGSGKSYTLSTLLENCLIPCQANRLPRPLTGLIFHYDTFISDTGGNACEAAYLASHQAVKVRVLCAPTNVGHIKARFSSSPYHWVD